MKPILYESFEKDFITNGIGILADAVSCYVDTAINSEYELELQYPVDGIHYKSIKQDAIILATTAPSAAPQPFRIYHTSKPMEGKVKVYARHIAYDLIGIPIEPFTAESASEAMESFSGNAAVTCSFSFETDKHAPGTMKVDAPTDCWKLLGKSSGGVLAVYGGEYEFDRWTIRLRERLGENRGVAIRYGKNLTSVTQDENCGDVYTGVYPYWMGKDGQLVTLAEKIVPAAGTFDHVKILVVDLSNEFDEAPTEAQLRSRAERYIRDNEVGVPEISWTVSYVQLSQTEEYKDLPLMEEIQLGDTVTVIFPKMGINVTSRVVKTRWNVLYGRHENISLGKAKKTISDTIAKQSHEVSRLGGGLGKAELEIRDTKKTVDGIRMDTNSCIADIGDVRAGLYTIASADDIKGLKEGNATLFAQIYDNFEAVYSGLESRVKSEDFGRYVEAQNELKATIGDAQSGLIQKVTSVQTDLGTVKNAQQELTSRVGTAEAGLKLKAEQSTVNGIDGRLGKVETASAKLSSRIGEAEASLELTATKDELSGLSQSVADLQADVVKINGVFTVTDTQVTAIRQLIAASGLQIGKDHFYLYGQKVTPQQITSTSGAVFQVLGC